MKRYLSLFLKAIIVVAAVWGISICAFDANAFMGGKAVWLYFTIQSNIWMVLVALLVGRLYIFVHQKIKA